MTMESSHHSARETVCPERGQDFTISGSVTPGMTVSGNSVTVWAVRGE